MATPASRVPIATSGHFGECLSETGRSLEHRVRLLQLAEELGNVSLACRTLQYSRDSYYRLRRLWEEGGEKALLRQSRRKPLLKNRVPPEVEEAVVALTLAHPRWARSRIAQQVHAMGHRVSPTGVRCIWIRHELATLSRRVMAASKVRLLRGNDAVRGSDVPGVRSDSVVAQS